MCAQVCHYTPLLSTFTRGSGSASRWLPSASKLVRFVRQVADRCDKGFVPQRLTAKARQDNNDETRGRASFGSAERACLTAT